MSRTTWYHNITKKKFNESDIADFFDDYTEGDIIMKSEDGCAIIEDVLEEELKSMYTEYIQIRDDWEEWEDNHTVDERPLLVVNLDIEDPSINFITNNFSPEMCNCGNYSPTSTTGVIIEDCRNCGNKPKTTRLGL